MPNALLVYPEHPPTYWGANFALEIVGIKAAFPPLGLITIAAMFPPEYDLRVVDMNVTPLEESDLKWADMVFTSTMIVQRVSLQAVIDRCNRAGVPVVAGGPHPTTFHDEIEGVEHFVLDEGEEIFPEFLRDLENGTAKAIYREPRKPDVTQTPVPRFDLIDMKHYHSMGVQFSRGCPFDCEFCDITKLYGRVPRTKTPDQMVNEFELLYRLGWRGQVFLVDDNFIGNKRDAMNLLPALAEWQRAHGYPFSLSTEASVNLARMGDLMDAMIEAGFDTVFLGIETPNPKALLKTKKPQNVSKREENYLFNAVRKIQQKGMQVQGGFILGLDGDDEDVFDAQIDFIQEVGIPVAPIYLLTALKGTDMYNRLKLENRLLEVSIGGNATTLNFRPEMDPRMLIEGYRRVTATLYDPTLENYFKRCLTLFEYLKPVPHLLKPRSKNAIYADLMGVRGRLSANQVPAYMNFIAKVSKDHPRMLSKAIRLAALGYHFEKITSQQNEIQCFKEFLAAELEMFKEQDVEEIGNQRQALLTRVQARYESIPDDFRYNEDGIEQALENFRFAVNAQAEHLAAV
ncbi:MAG: DUF4070 domain-containing protein [Gemmatimonadetes bacterium]|nr:DUF4070 domain-containing protein [Gemmatimonadota bacterium]MYB55621.1 DUF4070 domain-containing protein [Gemmatimonadota bacterium]MYD63237.1 DUF4070 domain-containing protein [Gemmatimonadota bacterium]